MAPLTLYYKSMKHVDGVQCLHGGLYKRSHEAFIKMYENISCNKSSAMNEVVMRQNKALKLRGCSNASKNRKACGVFLKQYALCSNTGISVRRRETSSFPELKYILDELFKGTFELHHKNYGKP